MVWGTVGDERESKSAVAYFRIGRVGGQCSRGGSRHGRNILIDQQVVGTAVIIVSDQGYPVMEKPQVQSHIILRSGSPAQLGVGKVPGIPGIGDKIVATDRAARADKGLDAIVGPDFLVSAQPPACPNRHRSMRYHPP